MRPPHSIECHFCRPKSDTCSPCVLHCLQMKPAVLVHFANARKGKWRFAHRHSCHSLTCHAHAVVGDHKKYSIADCRSESRACFGDYKQSFFCQLSSSRQSCNGCDNLGGFLVFSNLVSKCRVPRLSELCENRRREDAFALIGSFQVTHVYFDSYSMFALAMATNMFFKIQFDIWIHIAILMSSVSQ